MAAKKKMTGIKPKKFIVKKTIKTPGKKSPIAKKNPKKHTKPLASRTTKPKQRITAKEINNLVSEVTSAIEAQSKILPVKTEMFSESTPGESEAAIVPLLVTTEIQGHDQDSFSLSEEENNAMPSTLNRSRRILIVVSSFLLALVVSIVFFSVWKIYVGHHVPPHEEMMSTVTPTIAITPTPTINLSQYTIRVLNGSGTSGVAASTKNTLTSAGFSVVSIGNADTVSNTETTIAAKPSVDKMFLEKLREVLSGSYTVTTTDVPLDIEQKVDIIITVGATK